MDVEKLMNPEQETFEDKVAEALLKRLDARLEKHGKSGDLQVAMRIVLRMAEALNESAEEEEEDEEGDDEA